jgi:flagellar protein FliT
LIVAEEQSGLLAAYESAWAVTRKMLDAARKGEWEELVRLEKLRAGLIARIQATGDPDRDGRDGINDLIVQIIDADKEISRLTRDELAEIEEILGSVGNERKLLRTYQSG